MECLGSQDPFWHRSIIFDHVLKRNRRQHWSELTDEQKMNELEYQARGNARLLRELKNEHV